MVNRIYTLSQPFGADTPLWPFPGPRQDLIFQRGEYLERFHKGASYISERCMPVRIWMRQVMFCIIQNVIVCLTRF